MSLVRLAVALLVALALPRLVAAQAEPRLVAAVALAQEGRSDSARAIVSRVLAGAPPTGALYAEALFTAARVARDADEMRRNLQRVTVEHPLSPWADDALLALAELEYASGNVPGARRHLERFRTDHAASPLFADAAFWAARAAFDARDERDGCTWVGMGLARAQAPGTRAQLDFFARRCSAAALAAGSAAAPPAPPAPPAPDTVPSVVVSPAVRDSLRADPGVLVARLDTTPAQPAVPMYRVQVVAAADRGAADAAASRVRALGFEVRIVEEGGFHKVRAGAWPTRGEAQEAAGRLGTDFPGAFPVRDTTP